LKKLEEWKYTELCANLFLGFASLFVILTVHLLRDKSLLLSGKEPYFYLENWIQGWIIGFFSNFDKFLVAKIIPIIFGVGFILLFYNTIKKLGFGREISFISCIILVISPGFIYLFSTYNGFFLPVFILLLTLYLFLKNSSYAFAMPYLLAFFGVLHSVIFLSLFLVYSISIKKFRNFFYVLPSLFLSMFFMFFTPGKLALEGGFIADFGSRFGVGIFVILLFVFGFISLWREKYKYVLLYGFSFLLFLLSYYDIRVMSYLNILLCLIAAIGLEYVLMTKWESNLIKNTIVVVLVAGLFVSSISFASFLAGDLPNEEIIEGLEFMKEEKGNIVLSLESRAYWLSGLGEKETIEVDELFYIRNIKNSTALLDMYGIDYVWVDKEMKDKLWGEEDEGLLFLLDYSQKFKKIFNNDYVGVWRVE